MFFINYDINSIVNKVNLQTIKKDVVYDFEETKEDEESLESLI